MNTGYGYNASSIQQQTTSRKPLDAPEITFTINEGLLVITEPSNYRSWIVNLTLDSLKLSETANYIDQCRIKSLKCDAGSAYITQSEIKKAFIAGNAILFHCRIEEIEVEGDLMAVSCEGLKEISVKGRMLHISEELFKGAISNRGSCTLPQSTQYLPGSYEQQGLSMQQPQTLPFQGRFTH